MGELHACFLGAVEDYTEVWSGRRNTHASDSKRMKLSDNLLVNKYVIFCQAKTPVRKPVELRFK